MKTKEEYLLICLAEECVEVAQRICKAQRFGLEEIQESNPNETRNNRTRIIEELNDLVAVADKLGELNGEYNFNATLIKKKKEKLEKYMTYSQNLGILE